MGRNGSYVMVDLIWLTPPVIAGGRFVVLCIMLALWRLKRGQHRQSETLRQQIRNLDRELQKSNKQLLEVRSVMVRLGQKSVSNKISFAISMSVYLSWKILTRMRVCTLVPVRWCNLVPISMN